MMKWWNDMKRIALLQPRWILQSATVTEWAASLRWRLLHLLPWGNLLLYWCHSCFFLNPSQSIQIETCVNRQQTNEARARHASRRFWTYTSRQNFRATHARPVLQHRPLETCAFLMLLWNTSKLLLANTWNSKTGSLACADVAWIWPGTWWAWIARWQLLTTLTCIDSQPYCILKSWRKMKLGLFLIFHNNCALCFAKQ